MGSASLSTSLTATATLHLPVNLHGIKLGRPVDLLLDTDTWQTIGYVVRCGDESHRFLPFAASQTSQEEIRVGSALMLLEDVGFYRTRGTSFRSLIGGEVQRSGRPAGRLRDLVLANGEITDLELDRGGAQVSSACPQAAPWWCPRGPLPRDAYPSVDESSFTGPA